MRIIKKITRSLAPLLLIAVMVVTTLTLLSPQVHADAKSAACEGAGLVFDSSNGECAPPTGSPSVNDTVQNALNLFSAIVGIIAVIMLIVGGINYITSQGDSSKTTKAKDTILYAAIGLVIVALAQVISHFVLERFA